MQTHTAALSHAQTSSSRVQIARHEADRCAPEGLLKENSQRGCGRRKRSAEDFGEEPHQASTTRRLEAARPPEGACALRTPLTVLRAPMQGGGSLGTAGEEFQEDADCCGDDAVDAAWLIGVPSASRRT